MDSFFYWSGVFFWVALSIPVGWLLFEIVKEAYICGIFVYRRLRYITHGGFKKELPLYRTALSYWFFLTVGHYSRPLYITDPETGNTIWWPGRENEETDEDRIVG